MLLDENGALFLDRDGEYFAPLLGFLRTGELSVPPSLFLERVYSEAQFYQILLPPPPSKCLRRFQTKIVLVLYHSFDDATSFKKKLEFEIEKLEKQGWEFMFISMVNGSMSYGLTETEPDHQPVTWFLYFRRPFDPQENPPNAKIS